MMKRILTAAAIAAFSLPVVASAAGGAAKAPKAEHWSWEGPFGEYDRASVQRGFQVYRQICSSCHSMKLLAFRHLGDPGGPFYLEECPAELGLPENVDCSDPAANPIIKSLAAEYTITDGPDEFGDMFDRPGLPSDYFPQPFANKQQAIAANGGAYPPDMSLLAKARANGPSYIYSLLTGYPETDPEVLDVTPGQYYNPYYPGDSLGLMKEEYLDEEGHVLKDKVAEVVDKKYISADGTIYGGAFKMAQPLVDCIIEYDDGTDCSTDQLAKDVSTFLMWAAEPKLEERKDGGKFVLAYLVFFAGVTYMSYRQIWSNIGK